ncbi:Pectinesterase inhibitor 11 [Forsythia ovata]|uniref:Pectinesterase inhibitor 11 n=1 Tax=Forsythia ovata TaxID=205694 RepID=A0ABD1WWF6_9LAMI
MVIIRLSFLFFFVFSLVGAMHPVIHRQSRARAFVESQCRATLYPELYVRCLSNLVTNSNGTQLSHQQLAQTALRVSLARAQSTRIYITEVSKQLKKSKAKDYQQVKDCFDQINDGVDEITNSIKELQQMNEDGESEFPLDIAVPFGMQAMSRHG